MSETHTSEARLTELLRSPKRRKFVIAYVENGGNATAAAESAGFAHPREEGYRLLQNDHIIEAIDVHANICSRVAGESRDTVLDRIRNRANVDPRDYFRKIEVIRGEGEDARTVEIEELRLVSDLTKAQAQCIKKISYNTQGFPTLEFHDAMAADRDLARLMGMEPKETEALSAEDAAQLITAALDRMDELDAPESSGD